MEIGEIISESIRYPINDMGEFLKVALLTLLLIVPLLIVGLTYAFSLGSHSVSSATSGIAIVGVILLLIGGLIFYLIFPGYSVSVMKEGIDRSGMLPQFEIGKNIVDTIKLWILSFIYGIIPSIIVTVLFFVFAAGASGVSYSSSSQSLLAGGFLIIALVAFVLYLVFGIFLLIGTLRFANTGSLSEGLSFSEIIEDLKLIGIGKLIALYILIAIIIGVIALIGALVSLTVIGVLLVIFFLLPYTVLFTSYAYGLLYSDVV